VGAPGSLASPLRGPATDIIQIGGGRIWVSDIASQGPTIEVLQIGGGHSRVFGIAS
jgi:hypothetical protein